MPDESEAQTVWTARAALDADVDFNRDQIRRKKNLVTGVVISLLAVAVLAVTITASVNSSVPSGIGSIATVFGAAATARIAVSLWAVAGILMLFIPWPANLAAIAALPYLISVAPYLNVGDAHSGTANPAWRRFLAINYAVGFAVTLLLILCVTEGLFS